MALQPAGKPTESESDLAQMWLSAVRDYDLEMYPKSLVLPTPKSMQDIMKGNTVQSNSFIRWRYSDKDTKLGKVRKLFTDNIDTIRTVLSKFNELGDSAKIFPPAAPVGYIFSAFDHVLKSFSDVSADYDLIETFFTHSLSFFDRLSMLEGHCADLPPLQRCVVKVFRSQLDLCAIAQKEEGRRLRKWLSALVAGQDSALKGKYDTMDNALKELNDAIGMGTYNKVSKTLEEFRAYRTEINVKIDQQGQQIRMDLQENRDQMVGRMVGAIASMLDGKLHSPGGPTSAKPKKLDQQPQQIIKDVGDQKHEALKRIKDFFTSDRFPGWDAARQFSQRQRQDMRDSFVHHTCTWFVDEDPIFSDWLNGKVPVLFLTGSNGVGKSFLAYRALRRVYTKFRGDAHRRVAFFFFKDSFYAARSVMNSLGSAAWQISESDTKYCEHLAVVLKSKKTPYDIASLWEQFFALRFDGSASTTEKRMLFLILDGLDEADEDERKELFSCLSDITQRNLNIYVLLTGRPDLQQEIQHLNPSIIQVTADRLSSDITTMIKACFKLPRIRRFSKKVQSTILRQVQCKADGMLYVDYIMRRLDRIGHEGAVLKELKNLPGDSQSLFNILVTECYKTRTKRQKQALITLFTWLAFGITQYTPIYLSTGTAIVDFTVGKTDIIDMQDELLNRSALLLEPVRYEDKEVPDADELEEGKLDENNLDDTAPEDYPTGEDETTWDQGLEDQVDEKEFDLSDLHLEFRDRSLRDFFRAGAFGEDDLRPSPSEAHLLIFEKCVEILATPKQQKIPEGLMLYVGLQWIDHFLQITHEITISGVPRLLVALHTLFNNEIVASNLETYGVPELIFPVAWTDRTVDTVSWVEKVREWVEDPVYTGRLTPDIRSWLKHVSAKPSELLVPLHRNNAKNWFASHKQADIINAFNFVTAFLNYERDELNDENVYDEICNLADNLDFLQGRRNRPRAIGAVLLDYINTKLNNTPDDAEQNLDDALFDRTAECFKEWLNGGGRKAPSSHRFHAYWMLSQTLLNAGRNREASQACRDALAELKSDWKNNEEIASDVIQMFQDKAFNLAFSLREDPDLVKNKEWTAEFDEAREIVWPETLTPPTLNEMADVYDEVIDPTGEKLINLLKSWKPKERLTWFDHYYTNDANGTSIWRFEEAAKHLGEQDFLLSCYKDYERSRTRPGSSKRIFILAELAAIYKNHMGDTQKAKELYKSILSTKVRFNDKEGTEEKISEVRLALADLILADFMQSADPTHKNGLKKELENIDFKDRTSKDRTIHESHAAVMLAIMSRIMGPATEFENHLKKTFDKCIEDLSDAVGWNDSGSFRLLAKVLSLMKGRERDALISLSCQFYDVDPARSGVETDSDSEDIEIKDSVDDATAKNCTEDGSDGIRSEGLSSRLNEQTSTTSVITVNTQIGLETFESAESDPVPEQDAEDPKDTELLRAVTTIDTIFERGKLPFPPPADAGSDFNEMAAIYCNGCGETFKSWDSTNPIYLCLICSNCDLCPECYNKRVAANADPHSDLDFCGRDHRYIRGPIEGWRGVKNGMIRIGEEELAFQEWLNGLRDVRWQEAWTDFWRTQGGLKNITYSFQPKPQRRFVRVSESEPSRRFSKVPQPQAEPTQAAMGVRQPEPAQETGEVPQPEPAKEAVGKGVQVEVPEIQEIQEAPEVQEIQEVYAVSG